MFQTHHPKPLPETGTTRDRVDSLRKVGLDKSMTFNVLAEALRAASPDEVTPLACAILRIGHPDSIPAVMQASIDVDSLWKRVLRGNDVALVGVLASIGKLSAEELDRLATVLARGGPATVALVCAAILRLPADESTHEKAAAGLSASARLALGTNGQARTSVLTSIFLDQAIGEGLSTYPLHRRREVLDAAALALGRGWGRLEAAFEEDDHAGLRRVRAACSDVSARSSRLYLLQRLGQPDLSHALVRRLPDLRKSDACAEVYQNWHWLRTPRRRILLKSVDQSNRCLPEVTTAITWAAEAQRGLVAAIEALPLSSSLKVRRLADCIALTDDLARLLALRHLVSRERIGGRPETYQFSFDSSAAVSVFAVHAWLSQADSPEAGRNRLLRNAETDARVLAARRSATIDHDLFVEHFDQFRPHDVIGFAHRLLAADRSLLLSTISRILTQQKSVDRALWLIRRLNLASEFDAELVQVTRRDDLRAMASAILLLGECRSTPARTALRDGLHHSDSRVQANAVEAIGRLHDPDIDAVIRPWLESSAPRARANATICLKDVDRDVVRRSLERMLASPSAPMRLSGYWAARRLGDGRLVDVLGECERNESTDRLRRAAAISRSWLQVGRSNWRQASWAA